MKFLSFELNGANKTGIMLNTTDIFDTALIPQLAKAKDMIEIIELCSAEVISQIKEYLIKVRIATIDINKVKLLSPIIRPRHDIICLGLNYKDHLEECENLVNAKKSALPVYFSKRADEILAHKDNIPDITPYDKYLDYEVELAVIIGKRGKDIPAEKAEDYIFGYSVFNDLTARGLQKVHQQWFRGKSLDGLSAMGPFIVHKDDIPYPPTLNVTAHVNGELRQESNTSLFINDIPTIISNFSLGCTLEPGDIIITGTPGGAGFARNPAVYLKSGDNVVCSIENIGSLENNVL